MIIESDNANVLEMKGLHLYHYLTSICAARVRIALAEKSLEWSSHHVDLRADEQISPGYLEINPRGVVPTLVHNGQIVIESNDILYYLEENFPQPTLLPEEAIAREKTRELMVATKPAFMKIATLSFEFLFKAAGRKKTQEELDEYADKQKQNPEAVSFLRQFSSEEGFSEEDIYQALAQLDESYRLLDDTLSVQPWLSGTSFGLADISWLPFVHRTWLMRYPLDRFQHLDRWYHFGRQRTSFQSGVLDWEPRKMRSFFRMYTLYRQVRGTGVSAYI